MSPASFTFFAGSRTECFDFQSLCKFDEMASGSRWRGLPHSPQTGAVQSSHMSVLDSVIGLNGQQKVLCGTMAETLLEGPIQCLPDLSAIVALDFVKFLLPCLKNTYIDLTETDTLSSGLAQQWGWVVLQDCSPYGHSH